MDKPETPEQNGEVTETPPEAAEATPAEEAPAPSPWNQVVFIFVVAAVIFLLYRWVGLDGVWNIAKAALGLGLMIFIHELGHFLVAKWCDVQVETFSIGFGPAIPGCSFRWGETVYKLAMIPLGGYVKMIGEGDGEEHDDNPRSFKNKPVGQRMMIISAGVVMNVILASICFIAAYMMGVRQGVAAVSAKEPGSPAWKDPKIRTGDYIEKIGKDVNPTWEDLNFTVVLSAEGEKIPIGLVDENGKEASTEVVAIRAENDSRPRIGIAPLWALKLPSEKDSKRANIEPVIGAAADARVVDVKKVIGIVDPDGNYTALNFARDKDHELLAEKMRDYRKKEFKLRVKKGEPDVPVAVGGFKFGDRIVAMTKPSESVDAYDPFDVTPLHEGSGNERFDYFEFARRMQRLAGKAVVVTVERGDGKHEEQVSLLVPAAYHRRLPFRMEMGTVAALRDGSPAKEAGVATGDTIDSIRMNAGGRVYRWEPSKSDPMRLPHELRQFASGAQDIRVLIKVKHKGEDHVVPLKEVSWWPTDEKGNPDKSWRYEQEYPMGPASPMAIPELGIAYMVGPKIADVDESEKGKEKAPQVGDEIYGVRYWARTKADQDDMDWSSWGWFGENDDEAKDKPQPWWARNFQAIQSEDSPKIHIRAKRGDDTVDYEVECKDPVYDWPMEDRGFHFEQDTLTQRADSPLQALGMGMKRTYRTILGTYKSLAGMVLNPKRLPVAKNLRGPVAIAQMAYEVAGVDLATFLIFLGAINISLAVVNFLPIPILDGGHMVFLIYEKIRGKPASDHVRLGLTYAGLAFLLALMAFVLYLDIGRLLKK